MPRLFRNRLFAIGLSLFMPIVVIALAAPLLTSYNPTAVDSKSRLLPMSSAHWFGTDELGRDIMARVIYGARISLGIGSAGSAMTVIVGIIFGLLAGYFRLLDTIISRFVDALMIFPGMILMIMLMAAMGQGIFTLLIAMTVLGSASLIRIVRAAVLEAKAKDYVEAARVTGAGDVRILLREILPNTFAPLVVQISFMFASTIVGEASASFLGLGVPQPAPSWGNIIGSGRDVMRVQPWMMIAPGVMISLSVVALNLIGDGLRDVLDPRLRGVTKGSGE
jgi:peptide/nickel transport system permease protein